MTFTSTRLGQFTYFSRQLGERMWRGKDVLDFGGNIGNILRDPNSTIDPERYWCLDVDQDSIDQGQASFPLSHWLYYNRFSFFFNPCGVPNLPLPQMDQTFDYILAFSVFTNTNQADMLQLVAELKGLLREGGALAFTFIDPYFVTWGAKQRRNNLQWRLDLEVERENVSAQDAQQLDKRARQARWFTLVNATDLYLETDDIKPYLPEQQKTFHVFHTAEYMGSLFPEATVLPPVNKGMQHCCILRK